MKRLLAMLLSSVLLVSCGEYEPEENKVDIKDELKISAYLLGEEFEGNGYWAYSEDLQYINQGYWVSDDGREYEDDEVFALASSKSGEVSAKYMYGLITLPYIGWAAGTALGEPDPARIVRGPVYCGSRR